MRRNVFSLALPFIVIVFMNTGSAGAAQQGANSIDGKWDVTAESPHGQITMELDLTLAGESVGGTLLNFRGEKQPVKGEFTKGTLTFETTSGDEIAFTAMLKADGTLAGQLSTPMGDLNWSAARPKKSK